MLQCNAEPCRVHEFFAKNIFSMFAGKNIRNQMSKIFALLPPLNDFAPTPKGFSWGGLYRFRVEGGGILKKTSNSL